MSNCQMSSLPWIGQSSSCSSSNTAEGRALFSRSIDGRRASNDGNNGLMVSSGKSNKEWTSRDNVEPATDWYTTPENEVYFTFNTKIHYVDCIVATSHKFKFIHTCNHKC